MYLSRLPDRLYRLGKQYGYPPCCIAEFVVSVAINHRHNRYPRTLYGSGYLPCEQCNNTYTDVEMIQRINKLRDKSIKPFNFYLPHV